MSQQSTTKPNHGNKKPGKRFFKGDNQGSGDYSKGKPVILQYGENNNFATWIERMSIHCAELHGRVATVLKTKALPMIPVTLYKPPSNVPIDASLLPAAEEDEDDSSSVASATATAKGTRSLAKSAATQATLQQKLASKVNGEIFKAVANQHMQMQQESALMYGTVMKYISDKSLNELKKASDWQEIEINQNLVRLVEEIYKTHKTHITGISAIDKLRITELYTNLRQREQETFSKYVERFNQAIQAYDAVPTLSKPAQDDQAARFINGLDNLRYAHLKADLRNDALRGIANYPDTLAKAMKVAQEYVVAGRASKPSSNGESVREVAFVHSAEDQLDLSKKEKKKNKKNKQRQGTINEEGDRPTSSKAASPAAANNATSSTARKSGKTKVCKICKVKNDHWCQDCPHLPDLVRMLESESTEVGHVHLSTFEQSDDDIPEAMNVMAEVVIDDGSSNETCLLQNHGRRPSMTILDQYDVLLDNQATVGVFKDKELLTNMSDSSKYCVIQGIGGTVRTNQVGEFKPFGKVYYSENAVANVIPLGAVENDKRYKVTYKQGVSFSVEDNESGNVLTFCKRKSPTGSNGALYVYNAGHLVHRQQVMVTTVEQQEAKYTKKEILRAKAAKELLKRLGFPSVQTLVDMISKGVLLNNEITVADVHRAVDIYGKSLGELKGKSVDRKVKDFPENQVSHVVQTDLDLFADIMFLEGIPFLVLVSQPLDLLTCVELTSSKVGVITDRNGKKRLKTHSRDTENLFKAIMDVIVEYQLRGFTVKSVCSDGEGGLIILKSKLQALGIKYNPNGPGKHVPIIERRIRVIKERLRALMSVLPFKLPKALLSYALRYCIGCINMQPSSLRQDAISPREAFTGIKVDAKRDLRVSFGDYCQVYQPNIIKNSMVPRTVGAIALGSKGNKQGSVIFFLLDTKKVVTRDQFTILPMPQEVITHLNNLAMSGEVINLDPMFEYGDEEMLSSSDDEDEAYDGVVVGGGPNFKEVIPQEPPTTVPFKAARDDDGALQIAAEEAAEKGSSSTPFSGEETTFEAAIEDTVPVASNSNSIVQPEEPLPWWVNSQQLTNAVYTRPKELVAMHQSHISLAKGMKLFKNRAIEAVNKEMKQMIDLKVFEPVMGRNVEPGVDIIYSTIFFKEKFQADGLFDKLKARWVAGGDRQTRHGGKEEYRSPTVDLQSFLLIAQMSALKRMKRKVIDIAGAFLHASRRGLRKLIVVLPRDIASVVIELIPEWKIFLRKDGSMLVMLNQALYGCIDSPLLWYKEIRQCLVTKLDLQVHPLDECVFYDKEKEIYICVYVDDLFIATKDDETMNYIENVLRECYKDITVKEGEVLHYLGMVLDFTTAHELEISMPKHVNELLNDLGINGKSNVPSDQDLFKVSVNFKDSTPLSASEREGFRSVVASLLYIAKRARPDFLLPVQQYL